MRKTVAGLAIGAAVMSAGGASAHHSYAMFDVQKEVNLHGVVKDFQWSSPHVWIDLFARDGSGKAVAWAIEAASPGALRRFGWTRSSLKPGDEIDLVIHPLKSGDAGGSLVQVILNGQVIGNGVRIAPLA